MSVALPIFAPDAVERALIAQAGQSIPVAVAVTATRPPKFTVPVGVSGVSIPISWSPSALDLFSMMGLQVFTNIPGLTAFTYSAASNLGGFNFNDLTDCLSFAFPNLTTVDASSQTGVTINSTGATSISLGNLQSSPLISINSNSNLASLTLGVLIEASLTQGVSITSNSSLSGSLNLSSLVNFPSSLSIFENGVLTVDLSNIVTISGQLVFGNAGGTLPSFSKLTSVSGQVLVEQSGMTIFSFPVLTTTGGGGLACQNISTVTTINIPNYVPTAGEVLEFNGLALTAASVNAVLAVCVAAAGFTSGGVNLSGGTSHAPTGQGITDKATLIARGVTVATN